MVYYKDTIHKGNDKGIRTGDQVKTQYLNKESHECQMHFIFLRKKEV